MMERTRYRGPARKRPYLIVLAVVLVLTVACLFYLVPYYPANDYALAAMQSDGSVTVIEEKDRIIFQPAEPKAGFVLYPGAKVDQRAYSPLLHALAKQGILSVVEEMPFHMAFFRMDAAKDVMEDFPQVEHWYIGGHSLGGSMAAAWLDGHSDGWDGIIFLASYSTSDLTDNALTVCSLYGSEDRVLNRNSLEKYQKCLPADAEMHVLSGGNHAGFAGYGPQKGDGTPVITTEAQVEQTASILARFILVGPLDQSSVLASPH